MKHLLSLLLTLALCAPAHAAITISSGTGGGAGQPEVSTGIGDNTNWDLTNVDVGDGIVACVIWWNNAGATLTSLSAGGTSMTLLTARGPSGADGNVGSRCGYLASTASSGTVTMNVQMSAPLGGLGIAYAVAVNGHNSSDFFEAENFGTATGANGSVSLTCASECAVFSIILNTSGDPTAGSGYTLIPLANQAYDDGGEYALSKTGTFNVDYAHSSGTYSLNAAAFNAAGGGPSVKVNPISGRGGAAAAPVVLGQ